MIYKLKQNSKNKTAISNGDDCSEQFAYETPQKRIVKNEKINK